MKVNREILEKQLILTIEEIVTSKDFEPKKLDNIKERLYRRNILNANLLLNGNIPLNMASIEILYALSEAIYKETQFYSIDPEKYFTDNEISIYKEYKEDLSQTDNVIGFNNMIQINDSHWIGRISVKYLVELYNNLKINYNPQTQRESGYIKGRKGLIFVPKLYMQAVKEIKRNILGGTYEPDEITINLLKDGEDSFTYKNGTITVNSGRLDIIDGWHRSSAILEAVAENPEIEMYFELRFVNFDIQKARDFIVQKNKQRKISEKHIQSLNVSDYHNSITRTLNESPKSDFRGKIVTTKHLINKGYGLVTFDIIANAIDANFDIKTRSQSEKIQEYLISFFNEIYGIYYNELNNRKGIYTEPFSFIGYVAIASVLYQNENWKTLLSDVLSRINFTTNNIFYQDIKDYQVNISKRNINRVSDYFKKMTEEGVK